MTTPLRADIYAAALSVGQRPATVRKWVSRRELTHHGYDHKRRVIVDIEELEALVAAKQAAEAAEAA
ncbi:MULTISPECIES: hypothetical protein [Streptomyces]|uniref:hypothetical protein n=1 Tax=Streptomyces TaxID=1883 RepID=UPI0029AFE7DA|nr:hypothetical protein [Streptomyces stelliscabiei]MDX2520576.1 hypothetical protein [Streptomyces stelliscabiei]MDX2552673.1 hypothetical protein [Streptomyces stelliscabiei]MDX2661357.1 hypothetical protein [Streptomyces stelliscabiei]MDX2788838.1 hypothetical protein [Streptomyces stelliscabiei]